MKKTWMVIGFIITVCLLAVCPNAARAQVGFEPVGADAFNRAVPADFYLEGNHIPVEKRNAVVLKNAKGARVVLGLIDTSGYSSQIQQKYIGMLITETRISVCGNALAVGSYGLGMERPAATSNADAPFRVYNQAGEKVGECAAKRDDSVKQPKPLAVTTAKGGPAKLYLGKYAIDIK
jgi:methionine-rich copper-binding protein CopC